MVKDHFYKQFGDSLQFDKVFFNVEESNKYGNVFIVFWDDKKQNKLGWACTTTKKAVCYVFEKEKQLIVIKMDALRALMFDNTFEKKQQKKNKDGKETYGYIIPINTLVKQGIASVYEM